MKPFKYCLSVAILLSLVFVSFAADARVERGCEGVIYALPGEIVKRDDGLVFGRGHTQANAALYPFESEQIVLIDGNGKCNKGQENKQCRRVAADAALKCASEIWKTRWDRSVPNDKCGNHTNASIREWGAGLSSELQTQMYGDVKQTIEYRACCEQVPSAKSMSLIVGYSSGSSQGKYAFTNGEVRRGDRANKACGRKEIFTTDYKVDCDELRSSGAIQCPTVASKPIRPTTVPRSSGEGGDGAESGVRKSKQPTAKTSKKTSTSSASRADIERELNKKKAKNNKGALRASPENRSAELETKLKYRAVFEKGNVKQIVSSPLTFKAFLKHGNHLAKNKGLRLLDFEVTKYKQKNHYVGVWEKSQGTSLLLKPLSIKNFNKSHKKKIENGLRLADFEMIKKGGKDYVVSLWRPGKLYEQFSPSVSIKGLKERNATLKSRNIFPVDIEARIEQGEVRYAVLWRRSSSGSDIIDAQSLFADETGFMPLVAGEDFKILRKELSSKGKRIVDIERLKQNGTVYFTALWGNGDEAAKLSKPKRRTEFRDLLKQKKNMRLTDFELVSEGS